MNYLLLLFIQGDDLTFDESAHTTMLMTLTQMQNHLIEPMIENDVWFNQLASTSISIIEVKSDEETELMSSIYWVYQIW